MNDSLTFLGQHVLLSGPVRGPVGLIIVPVSPHEFLFHAVWPQRDARDCRMLSTSVVSVSVAFTQVLSPPHLSIHIPPFHFCPLVTGQSLAATCPRGGDTVAHKTEAAENSIPQKEREEATSQPKTSTSSSLSFSFSHSEAMLEESVTRAPSIWATINSWFTPSVFFVLLNLTIGTIFITSSLSTHKPKEEEEEPHHQQQQQQQQHEESPKPLQFTRSPSILQKLKSINLYSYRSQEPNTHFGKTPETETHYGFLPQSPELGQEQEGESEKEAPFLTRSPSMLDRLKSFNLYKYVSQETSFSLTHHSSEQTHEPEQQRAQAEEEEQDDPAGDEEPGEQELEDVEEEEEGEEDEQSLDDVYSQLKENHVQRTKSDTKPASGEVTPKLPSKMRKSASVKSAFAHFEEDDIVEARRPATTREGKSKASHEVDEGVDAKADDFINRFKQQLKLQRLDSFMRYKETINRGNGK